MTPDDALELVVKTARRNIRTTVDAAMCQVRDGRQPEFKNPFSGQMQERPVPKQVRDFAEKLRAAGLHQDPQFMTSFKEFLTSIASAPMFHFFAAVDGEGSFEGNAQFELRLCGGAAVPEYLHDKLYPIEAD